MNKKLFFTTGYLGDNRLLGRDKKKVETFDRMVRESLGGLLVVDTRLNPWSRAVCWRSESLMDRLDSHYISVKDWGNLNYRSGEIIQIRDFQSGLTKVEALTEATGMALLLLCGCEYHEDCHRSVLGDKLKAEGWSGWEAEHWGRIEIEGDAAYTHAFNPVLQKLRVPGEGENKPTVVVTTDRVGPLAEGESRAR